MKTPKLVKSGKMTSLAGIETTPGVTGIIRWTRAICNPVARGLPARRSLATGIFLPSILIASVVNYAIPASADPKKADWPFAGADLHNTANAPMENKLSPSNVGQLAVKWIYDTLGFVSATPAVVDGAVYVTDWGVGEEGGYIYI